MPTPQISHRIRTEIYNRLAAVDGFNKTLATRAIAYDVEYFDIDFESSDSPSFFFGAYGIDDIYDSGIVHPNVLCLYSQTATETNQQKFLTFSGTVTMVIDVHMSWLNSGPVRNKIEDLTDAVEETLIDVLNRESNQNWATNLGTTYNGGISVDRGPISFGAENWQRTVSARLNFEMHAL